jgi:putative membrane protein
VTHAHQPLLAIAAAIGYTVLTAIVAAWPGRRTVSFLTGSGLLVIGLIPQTSPWPAGDFRTHMLQHLLIGMLAPLGLVLGAPVTLLLRAIPRRAGRVVGRILRSRPVHVLAGPVVALILNLGGIALLHLTPLYATTTRDPGLHLLVHMHFLLAGYLFAWVVAGPDPAPRRPSVPVRLMVLGVAIAFHAVFSQLMFAGVIVNPPVPRAEREGGAELMYYGGDIAELLLAAALVTRWRPRRQGTNTARTQSSFFSLKMR